LHVEELRKFYSSPNTRTVKSSITRRAGHVACIEKIYMHRGFWLGNLKAGDYLENLDIDGG
jgi:hypothetical protein